MKLPTYTRDTAGFGVIDWLLLFGLAALGVVCIAALFGVGLLGLLVELVRDARRAFAKIVAAALACALYIVLAGDARAEGLKVAGIEVETVGVHIASHHFPRRHWHNFNQGLYVRTHEQWVGGFFYNSERRWSAYAGRDFHIAGPFDVRVGIVTGYLRAPVLPLAALGLDIGAGFKLAFIPPIDKSSGVLHLTYERKL